MPQVPFFQWFEFKVWISECETIKFLNFCRSLGMPRVRMQDMYVTPYIAYCKIVEFIGLNGMFGEHPKLLQGPFFLHAGALGHGLVPVQQIPSTHCFDVFQEQLFAGWQFSEQGLSVQCPLLPGCGSALGAHVCCCLG